MERKDRYRINRAMQDAREDRGELREARVHQALDHLRREGRIQGYHVSEELNKMGVDCIVDESETKHYKLQIKSSQAGIDHARAKYPERHRHGDVLFVIPGIEESTEDLAERLMEEIATFEASFHG